MWLLVQAGWNQMKNNKILFLFLLIFLCGNKVIAQTTSPANTPPQQVTTPILKPVNNATTITQQQTTQSATKQSISFESCVRAYQTSTDNLFLLILAAINSSGYKIDEMQSRTGLISFVAENRSFLASVTELDENSSMLKITPMNNSYAFPPTVLEQIFLYLTNNVK